MLVESFYRLLGWLGWCVGIGLDAGPVRGRPRAVRGRGELDRSWFGLDYERGCSTRGSIVRIVRIVRFRLTL